MNDRVFLEIAIEKLTQKIICFFIERASRVGRFEIHFFTNHFCFRFYQLRIFFFLKYSKLHIATKNIKMDHEIEKKLELFFVCFYNENL